MLLPNKVDIWWAEAVTRVYAPWLTSNCAGISGRQRREIVELLNRARHAACLPPLDARLSSLVPNDIENPELAVGGGVVVPATASRIPIST